MATKSVVVCDATGNEVDSHFRVEFTSGADKLSLDLSREGVTRLIYAIAEQAGSEGLERALDQVIGDKWRSMLEPSR